MCEYININSACACLCLCVCIEAACPTRPSRPFLPYPPEDSSDGSPPGRGRLGQVFIGIFPSGKAVITGAVTWEEVDQARDSAPLKSAPLKSAP